jgi:hypothetical protein
LNYELIPLPLDSVERKGSIRAGNDRLA